MKIFKKIFVTVLALVLIISNTNITTYAASINDSSIDYYMKNTTETVNINGVNYTYKYFYDANKNKTISVTNNSTNSIDTVKYNESTSTIYLNNNVISTGTADKSILNPLSASASALTASASSSWTLVGTYKNKITWAQGTTAAVVAAAVAIPLSSIGVSGIIAAIGVAALGTIAAASTGGTVYQTIYQRTIGSTLQVKDLWYFTASTGDEYGPYTNIY